MNLKRAKVAIVRRLLRYANEVDNKTEPEMNESKGKFVVAEEVADPFLGGRRSSNLRFQAFSPHKPHRPDNQTRVKRP
jgi:hypothetical protein